MKSFDELADRFESIPELPVSEEMLGAYIEETLSPSDKKLVEQIIKANAKLYDFVIGNLFGDMSCISAKRLKDMGIAAKYIKRDLY